MLSTEGFHFSPLHSYRSSVHLFGWPIRMDWGGGDVKGIVSWIHPLSFGKTSGVESEHKQSHVLPCPMVQWPLQWRLGLTNCIFYLEERGILQLLALQDMTVLLGNPSVCTGIVPFWHTCVCVSTTECHPAVPMFSPFASTCCSELKNISAESWTSKFFQVLLTLKKKPYL